jgi:hypothetical protein
VDEIPLRADQLVDNACPVCKGKVITKKADRTPEFSVIKRNQDNVFPAYKEGQPCCYKEKRATEVIAKDETKDDTYILGTSNLPERRLGFLSDQLARSLRIKTSYSTVFRRSALRRATQISSASVWAAPPRPCPCF